MIVLISNKSKQEIEIYSLVLEASGISHQVIEKDESWDILINEENYQNAVETIKLYIEENKEIYSDDETVYHRSFAGLWMSLFLLCCHIAVNTGDKSQILEKFRSSAYDVLNGEYYRTVTALFLHADFAHLIWNMAGMALFGSLVCYFTRWGIGCLLILLSGTLGNLVNAWLYQSGHFSIGASTAVFGAIGILVGYQFLKKIKHPERKRKAWLQVAVGLSLLALLGSSENTDITAHMFGFISGIVLGIGAALFQFSENKYQVLAMLLTIIIIALSWF